MRTYLKIVQAKIYVSISMNIEADQQSFNISAKTAIDFCKM